MLRPLQLVAREKVDSCFVFIAFARLSHLALPESSYMSDSDIPTNCSTTLSESHRRRLFADSQASNLPSRRDLSELAHSLKLESGEPHSFLQDDAFRHWFKNWEELRRNKLTASTFSGAIGFWRGRRSELWLEKLGFRKPFSGNLATCWNNIKEEEALERYKLITGNNVLLPDFQVYGKKNPEDSWLAASPDGVTYGLPSNGVLEIKCPFFNGDMKRASPWSRIPLQYIPQAQGLMEILDRDWMHFYVWTPKGSSLFLMYRDREYWDLLKLALTDFWWKHVQPARELCSKTAITEPLYQLRHFRPASRHELCGDIVCKSKRIVDRSELLVREIHGIIQN